MTRLHTLTAERLSQLRSRDHILGHHAAYATGTIPQDWLDGALVTPLETELPVLDADVSQDGESAVRLHMALDSLSRLTAADERLWAWLALAH